MEMLHGPVKRMALGKALNLPAVSLIHTLSRAHIDVIALCRCFDMPSVY